LGPLNLGFLPIYERFKTVLNALHLLVFGFELRR